MRPFGKIILDGTKHWTVAPPAANPDMFWYRLCGMGAQKNPPK